METIAATPDAWEFVELKRDGQLSVLNKFVTRTKAAGNRLLPILAPVSIGGLFQHDKILQIETFKSLLEA